MADKFKFVKTRIDKLTYSGANGKKQIFWDTDLPGAKFGLYITPTGIKTYFAQGRYPNGKPAQTVIGRTDIWSPEDARQKAIEFQKLYEAGKNPKHVEKQARALTLKSLFDEYLSIRKIKDSSKDHYRQQWDTHLSDWNDLHPTDVTKSMVLKRHAKVSVKTVINRPDKRKSYHGGPRVADATMQLLGFVIDYGMETHDELLMKNPVRVLANTKAYHGYSPRTGYFKPEELKGLFEGLNSLKLDTGRDYLETLLFTGGRADEVAALKVKDINLEGSFGVLRKTKTGKPLWVPFCTHQMEIFKRRIEPFKEDPEAFIFPSYGKAGYLTNPTRSIEVVESVSGLSFTPHYFRRSYKTYCKNLKIDSLVRKRLMNHALPSRNDMDEWYTQHEIEDLRPVVDQIAQYILSHAGVKKVKVIPMRKKSAA